MLVAIETSKANERLPISYYFPWLDGEASKPVCQRDSLIITEAVGNMYV
jgi:hypothetical protein